MAKAAKNNKKPKQNGNKSRTDLPDMKTTVQTSVTDKSMKNKIGSR